MKTNFSVVIESLHVPDNGQLPNVSLPRTTNKSNQFFFSLFSLFMVLFYALQNVLYQKKMKHEMQTNKTVKTKTCTKKNYYFHQLQLQQHQQQTNCAV